MATSSDELSTVPAECPDCSRWANAEVLGTAYQQVDDDNPSFGIRVLLCKCQPCGHTVVLSQSFEQFGDWPNDVDWYQLTRVWPMPHATFSAQSPDPISRDFDEAHRCLSVQAFTGAAMLARRVLEGIATDLGATGSTLFARLQNLQDRTLIDGRLVQWAHALRIVGNDAAHNVAEPVSADDARDALAFAQALGDYVYTFRARYSEFAQRRGCRTIRRAELRRCRT